MRRDVLTGAALAIGGLVAVVLGTTLDLDLDHVALLGLALGAVVGMVRQGRPWQRLLGFTAGFVVAWVGYALRAAVLPDSSTGRAVAVLLVVLGCTGVYLVARGWVPLWAAFLGVAALVGAYEETYTAAPPQFMEQSVSAATAVLLAAALGYFLSTLFLPVRRAWRRRHGPVTQEEHRIFKEIVKEPVP